MLIIPFCKPLVAAALGINHGPLVQLGLEQCHLNQLNGPNESATRSPVHRTG